MASKRALKLLERIRRSKANVKPKDIEALYLAFGFEIELGTNHNKVTHPKYPELYGSIPRHPAIAKYIVDQAIKLVDTLLVLEDLESLDNE